MNRYTLAMNLLVMFILVTIAGVLQDSSPLLPFFNVKPPLLMGVSAYYALRRPWAAAIPAVFWAGLIRDGLSAVPVGSSIPASVLLIFLCAEFGRTQLSDSAASCSVVCAVGSIIQFCCDAAFLSFVDRFAWTDFAAFLHDFVMTALAAVPAGLVMAFLAGVLDLWAVNTEKHAEDFDWSDSGL